MARAGQGRPGRLLQTTALQILQKHEQLVVAVRRAAQSNLPDARHRVRQNPGTHEFGDELHFVDGKPGQKPAGFPAKWTVGAVRQCG